MTTRERVARRFAVLVFAAVQLAAGNFMAAADSPQSGTNAPATAKLTDEQMSEMLQAAVLAARVGMYDEAEARCQQVLEQRPDNSFVKQLLAEIRERRRQQDPAADLKRKLQDITIAEVNVREAPVVDVVDFLQKEAQKQSKDKTPINLVWQVPEDSKSAKVTLTLRGVPLADVLRYVTEGAGLRYRVDPYAVVIYKPSANPKELSPPNVKSQ